MDSLTAFDDLLIKAKQMPAVKIGKKTHRPGDEQDVGGEKHIVGTPEHRAAWREQAKKDPKDQVAKRWTAHYAGTLYDDPRSQKKTALKEKAEARAKKKAELKPKAEAAPSKTKQATEKLKEAPKAAPKKEKAPLKTKQATEKLKELPKAELKKPKPKAKAEPAKTKESTEKLKKVAKEVAKVAPKKKVAPKDKPSKTKEATKKLKEVAGMGYSGGQALTRKEAVGVRKKMKSAQKRIKKEQISASDERVKAAKQERLEGAAQKQRMEYAGQKAGKKAERAQARKERYAAAGLKTGKQEVSKPEKKEAPKTAELRSVGEKMKPTAEGQAQLKQKLSKLTAEVGQRIQDSSAALSQKTHSWGAAGHDRGAHTPGAQGTVRHVGLDSASDKHTAASEHHVNQANWHKEQALSATNESDKVAHQNAASKHDWSSVVHAMAGQGHPQASRETANKMTHAANMATHGAVASAPSAPKVSSMETSKPTATSTPAAPKTPRTGVESLIPRMTSSTAPKAQKSLDMLADMYKAAETATSAAGSKPAAPKMAGTSTGTSQLAGFKMGNTAPAKTAVPETSAAMKPMTPGKESVGAKPKAVTGEGAAPKSTGNPVHDPRAGTLEGQKITRVEQSPEGHVQAVHTEEGVHGEGGFKPHAEKPSDLSGAQHEHTGGPQLGVGKTSGTEGPQIQAGGMSSTAPKGAPPQKPAAPAAAGKPGMEKVSETATVQESRQGPGALAEQLGGQMGAEAGGSRTGGHVGVQMGTQAGMSAVRQASTTAPQREETVEAQMPQQIEIGKKKEGTQSAMKSMHPLVRAGRRTHTGRK